MDITSIKAIPNSAYPKESISEHIVVTTYDDGIELMWQAPNNVLGKETKKGYIRLTLDKELDLLDVLLNHLRSRLG